MHLKHLILTGFKSFATRTKLDFSNGITAVVGPNGCGKSNIADAFRWVLGEQSAKSMRGPKMTDVIFAGTSCRKASPMTEVTIEFGEIEGFLPIPGMDISITRRLYANGDGEYLINNQKATLKQIRELLIDSGVGKDSFAIFEQGKINEVIELSATERRPIFEEAAGVLGIKKKKLEALKKLEGVDQNVLRLHDVYKEVEVQVDELEAQSKKAIRYKEDRLGLEVLEKQSLILKWQESDKKAVGALEKKQKAQELFELDSARLSTISKEVSEQKSLYEKAKEAFLEKKEALAKAKSQKELCLQNIANQSERHKDLIQKRQKWSFELESVNEKNLKHGLELKESDKKQQILQQDYLTKKKRLEEQKTLTSKQEESLAAYREDLQLSQKKLLEATRQEKQAEGDLKQNQTRLQNFEERLKLLKEQKTRSQNHITECEGQKKQKDEELKVLLEAMNTSKESLKKLEAKIADRTQLELSLNAKKTESEKKLNSITAREQALKKLKEERLEFSKGARLLLKESDTKGSPIYNHLKSFLELFTPQKQVEKGLLVALNPYKETLVTETDEALLKVLEFAEKKNIFDFSILSLEMRKRLSTPTEKKLDGDAKNISGFVETASEFKGLLQKTAVSESRFELALFKKLPEGVSLYLNEGVFYDSEAVFFIPQKGESVAENNAFTRQSEIKELEKTAAELTLLLNNLETELHALTKEKAQFVHDKKECEIVSRRQEMKHVELNFALKRLNEDLLRLQKDFERMSGDEKNLLGEIQTLKSAISSQLLDLNSSKTSGQKLLADSETLLKKVDEQAASHRSAQTLLADAVSDYHNAESQLKKEESTKKLLEMQQSDALKQKTKLAQEIEEAGLQERQFLQKSGSLQEELKVFEETLKVFEKDLKALDQEVQKSRQTLEKIELASQKQGSIQKAKELELVQIESMIAQFSSIKEMIEKEAFDRFGEGISKIEKTIPEIKVSLETAEKKIKELKLSIEQMGDVNMTSVEEWQKQKERLSHLKGQMTEVGDVKSELLNIIKALDEESSVKFLDTFEKIKENFKKNFALLFEGGEAELELTDPKNFFESGVEISAKPPGKHMRSIHLLSGGEKCLTAMALLFAIFEVKPAPFCILDEIDAPLDDSNVERFVRMVKKFSDTSQFIIITHNKRTMAIADVLLGVSMQEKGISTILSIEFSNTHVG